MDNKASASNAAVTHPSLGLYHVKMPDDWKRQIVRRKSGKTAGHHDVYLITPEGKKLRSRKQLKSFLENNYSHLTLADFSETIFKYSERATCRVKQISCNKQISNQKSKDDTTTKITSNQTNNSQDPKEVTDVAGGSIMNVSSPSTLYAHEIEEIHEIHRERIKLKEIEKEKIKHIIDKLETSAHFGKPSGVNKKENQWTPPRSPYNLVQEVLYHDEWQLLVATIFLNKTSCHMAIPKLWAFFEKWNSPQAVCEAEVSDIVNILKPLGLHKKRAQNIKDMSKAYLCGEWTSPEDLPGIGSYGRDSFYIFCKGNWKSVKPKDKKLKKYKEFLCSKYSGLKVRRTEVQV